jgi:hypothetical protein
MKSLVNQGNGVMRARTRLRLFGLGLACWLSTACSALDSMYLLVPPNPGNPIRTVAVLPLVNNTNDVVAPQYVRDELVLRLQALQYAVQPVLQTDQILRDQLGITLGRQLDLATVPQLKAALGVDGLIFGVLDDFATKNFGLLTEKRSRARFSFINASDGLQIWASGAGVIGRIRVVGGTAGKVALGFEAASRLEAAKESAGQAQKTAGGQSVGKLPGGLDLVPAPWFTIPTVEIGQEPTGGDKAKQEGGNVGAGLAAGLGEQLIERAAGKPLYQEVRLMLNLLLRPDAVAAADALALQRLEQLLAGRNPRINREQIMAEIATKVAEMNTIRSLRPLPVGPGAIHAAPGPAPVGNQPLP